MNIHNTFLMTISANNILHRGKDMLSNPHKEPADREFENFFYWILDQFNYELNHAPIVPSNIFHLEIIQQTAATNSDLVVLENKSRNLTYISEIAKEEFYKVMQYVTDFINIQSGYEAICYTPSKPNSYDAKMHVYMRLCESKFVQEETTEKAKQPEQENVKETEQQPKVTILNPIEEPEEVTVNFQIIG